MFIEKEKKTIMIGLQMYKAKLGKMLKQSAELSAGEKEVKLKFLETEALIDKVLQS